MYDIIKFQPNGILVAAPNGVVVQLNPSFCRHLGLAADTMPGQQVDTYIKDKGLCEFIRGIYLGLYINSDEVPAYEFSTENDHILLAHGNPIRGKKNACQGAVISIVDITAMRLQHQRRNDFIANISHELRSPLATIHEQLALALNDSVGQMAPSGTRLLSRAKEKTQGLISLIGDLLDLSRIETGRVRWNFIPVQLDDFFENIIEFLSIQASAGHQSLTLTRSKAALPCIKADPMALESIFGNLITNAIKYTPKGGDIEVRIKQSGLFLHVDVIDNGFGIETQHLDKIFNRFYRIKTSKTRAIIGTGLGLSIVKDLVDILGGIVHVSSVVNEGSTFTVILPLAQNRKSQ
jgi:PAS domain S-box-containing protein